MRTEIDKSLGQFCANPYINAVFVHYVQKFQELGAECRMEIQIGDEPLPYMDLCQILSNGLENAYDALKGIPTEGRGVSVKMRYNREYLIIRIKNRCREGMHVDKGKIPDTTKEGEEHGFGLLTVQEAAKRLGGEMFCYTEAGSFVLDVLVKIIK